MKCPNCKKQIDIIPPVERNLESYHCGTGKTLIAVSSCCNSAFNVSMETKFKYELYTGKANTDDWGNKILKHVK